MQIFTKENPSKKLNEVQCHQGNTPCTKFTPPPLDEIDLMMEAGVSLQYGSTIDFAEEAKKRREEFERASRELDAEIEKDTRAANVAATASLLAMCGAIAGSVALAKRSLRKDRERLAMYLPEMKKINDEIDRVE